MTHVLVTTDGSSGARGALRFTAKLLVAANVNRVTVLNVIRAHESQVASPDMALAPQATWDGLAAQTLADFDDALAEANDALADFAGPLIVVRRRGQRVSQIIDTADEVGADLIVMGSSRQVGGLLRFLRLGVVDTVLRRAHCPVLIVRTDQAA